MLAVIAKLVIVLALLLVVSTGIAGHRHAEVVPAIVFVLVSLGRPVVDLTVVVLTVEKALVACLVAVVLSFAPAVAVSLISADMPAKDSPLFKL